MGIELYRYIDINPFGSNHNLQLNVAQDLSTWSLANPGSPCDSDQSSLKLRRVSAETG